MVQFIRWTRSRVLFGMLALLLLTSWAAADEPTEETRMLAQVDVTGAIAELGIPIHAHLLDAAGQEYVLTLVSEQALQQRQLSYRIVDAVAALKPDEWYLLAYERRQGARQQAVTIMTVLYDDGKYLLVRATPSQAERLANLGFEIAWLRKRPMILRVSERLRTKAITPLPLIQNLIDQVTQSTLSAYTSRLSGVTPAIIGGASYTITTRHTDSGTPIQKATQYVYEHLQALGLAVRYQNWNNDDYESSGRNVIGELRGTTRPGEIVLITAHLDDMPASGLAPGADDNASGAAGVMVAADVMSAYTFERTVRFVFFTGEEIDFLGSYAYAESVYNANQNIVAVYNLDMIAWDNKGGPDFRLYTRLPSNPGYAGDLALAQLLVQVINTYGLSSSLTPLIISNGYDFSDHASFWGFGYAALWAIEDDDDFNPYYHTKNDKLQYLNMSYFTAVVKASLGSIAHQAVPIEQSGNSYILWTK
ncbi:putative aminopeptidase [Candidatus Vecturithrix granuli]|uniref:Putative aminopeptidase n=1 Tax=Vecturithrix granuli TaxID=1499967 RepID=A0A081BZL9_VECG1|nr:putative aminopeptidase [Candidatus Vecturithrix granuli]